MSLPLQEFVDRLKASRLLLSQEIRGLLAAIRQEVPSSLDGRTFAEGLVRRGALTPYQAGRVYHGRVDGLIFGGYTVLEKIGQGGMGKVYKALHRRLHRVVVLKLLSPEFAKQSPRVVDRFHQEIRAAGRLMHPNIATALDAGKINGVRYLAMEYVKGRDLHRVVKDNGPLPSRQAVDAALQSARGLEFMHRRGVLHRDIKPANLVRTKDGLVKIIDFGLARVGPGDDAKTHSNFDYVTQVGDFFGTVHFMAPEQAQDSRSADHRADLYSLGCTLFFLLIGRPPFLGENPVEVLVAHQSEPVPQLSQYLPCPSRRLENLVARLMSKSADHRPKDMAEAMRELLICQADEQPTINVQETMPMGFA